MHCTSLCVDQLLLEAQSRRLPRHAPIGGGDLVEEPLLGGIPIPRAIAEHPALALAGALRSRLRPPAGRRDLRRRGGAGHLRRRRSPAERGPRAPGSPAPGSPRPPHPWPRERPLAPGPARPESVWGAGSPPRDAAGTLVLRPPRRRRGDPRGRGARWQAPPGAAPPAPRRRDARRPRGLMVPGATWNAREREMRRCENTTVSPCGSTAIWSAL